MGSHVERYSAEISPALPARSPYIQYNRERDLPLMLAIRNATFISHNQLWEHVHARGLETSRRSFNWRIARLTQAGVAEKLPPLLPYPGPVYTITRAGLACPEACGEGFVSLTSESRTLANPNQMQHYLELAEVRGAIRRAGVLSGSGPVILKSARLTSRLTCLWRRTTTRLQMWNGKRSRTGLRSS